MIQAKNTDATFVASLGAAPRRFPQGTLTLVTDLPRVAAKLEAAAGASGVPARRDQGTVVIQVPEGIEDNTCLTFGAFLTSLEQERVFVLRDGVSGPQLRSLRRILAECQNAWFSEFLRAGSFTAFLQPIVDLEAGTTYGFEALLRASHVDGTPVPAPQALSIARATGSLVELDQRARRAAFEAARRHLKPSDRLFVNVDPDSVAAGVEDFRPTLEMFDRLVLHPPENVVFELIESEGIAGFSALDSLLGHLRDRGFKIALDDVGSGYSTVGVLERLRPDIVKLDRQIVRGAHANRYRARLVRAFVELTADLGLPLIAEGVETKDDYLFVRDQGIRLAQGFFLGKPAPTGVRHFPMLERSPEVHADAI